MDRVRLVGAAALVFAGFCLVFVGVWWLLPSAALIVAGVALVAVGGVAINVDRGADVRR